MLCFILTVSCNMLDQKPPGDGKSLAFGGLTHRRPPSPDLNNRTRKGPRSNESSESGSATGVPVGVDYTGKELQVALVQLALVNA